MAYWLYFNVWSGKKDHQGGFFKKKERVRFQCNNEPIKTTNPDNNACCFTHGKLK